ncbi:hypothetical protein Tco_1575065 [Tanacetum coccineum]
MCKWRREAGDIFRKRGEADPRYIRNPFRIIAKRGTLALALELPRAIMFLVDERLMSVATIGNEGIQVRFSWFYGVGFVVMEIRLGPFNIIAKVGMLAYRLELPEQLSRVHNTFYVSNLKKCFVDEPLAIPLEEIQIVDKLNFIEEPVKIMD